MFSRWIYLADPEPYESFGNGAAMRVSPAAFLNRDNLDAALAASDKPMPSARRKTSSG